MKVHTMKQRVQSFMMGRYGFDDLSKVHAALVIALMLLSVLADSQALYLAALILLCYNFYRVFSRNITKRQQENQKYRSLKYQSAVKWNAFKNRQAQKKIYRFYRCPQCRQRVRVPKGKGRICITCPKCRAEFIKRS